MGAYEKKDYTWTNIEVISMQNRGILRDLKSLGPQ